MPTDTSFVIFLILTTLAIIISGIGIIVSINFQRKQKKKYNQLKKIVYDNKDSKFEVKDNLSNEEINKIDDSIDVDLLMQDLYNTYITLEYRLKNFDTNIDDLVCGYLKDFYINKINTFKENNYKDIKENISLIGYSIIEFSKNKLKFRLNITCYDYKTINDKIVSGSDTLRVQEILLLSYEKIDSKWLISSNEKVYEKKLSE